MVKNKMTAQKKAFLTLKNLSAGKILRKFAKLSFKQIWYKYFSDALLALNNFGPTSDKISSCQRKKNWIC